MKPSRIHGRSNRQWHVPVTVGWPLVAALAAAGLTGRLAEMLLLLLLVVSHEAAHLAVAAGLGCRVEGLRLMPLGGALSLGSEVETVPSVEAIVAAVGPVHHLALLALASIAPAFPRALGPLWPFFVRANLTLAFFNLLPIYPLDGGRILRASLVSTRGASGATKIAVAMGRGLSLALAALGGWALWRGLGPVPLLCGLYLLWMGRSESGYLLAGHLLLQRQKRARMNRHGSLPLRCLAVAARAKIWPSLARWASRRYMVFLVIGRSGAPFTWVTEEQATEALVRYGLGSTFESLVECKNREEELARSRRTIHGCHGPSPVRRPDG